MNSLDDKTMSGGAAFLRLLSFWKPFKWHVGSSIVLAFAMVGAGLLVPWLTGRAIDHFRAEEFDAITRDALYIVLAAGLVAIISASRRIVSGALSLDLEKHLRDLLFAHISGLGFHFFQRQQTGQLLSRVTSDVTMVRFFLGYGLTYLFLHVAKLIGIPIVLWIVHPQLAMVVYLTMPLILLFSIRYSQKSLPIMREAQQKLALVTAHGEETIVGARVVRSFGQEQREAEKFRALTDAVVEQEKSAMRVKAKYQPLYMFIPDLTLLAIVFVAAQQINTGTLTLGSFFAFYGYVMMLTSPLRILGNLISRAQRATASSGRLWELLDSDEAIEEHPSPKPLPERRPEGSRVVFTDISFGYVEDRRVVDGVNLTIEPGQTIALIGATGCGKTTLASLIPRLYDPDASGSITLDGIDLRELDLKELRRSVGLVDQEPFLFSASVADNMRYGRPDAPDEDVWEALDAAQASEFVRRLPDGIETMIGERGLTISGGQRQRLAIARALVTNPRVLVLDDATASVDSAVEARIASALDSATQRRSTVIIAHRPSTIALADKIVVMDKGRITDQGTHDELIVRSETYRMLYEQTSSREPQRREFLLEPESEVGE